jgi:hypothetical protein
MWATPLTISTALCGLPPTPAPVRVFVCVRLYAFVVVMRCLFAAQPQLAFLLPGIIGILCQV